MPITTLFAKKGEEPAAATAAEDPKPVEKTPAELIAESINSALGPLTEKFDKLGERLGAVEQRLTPKTQTPAEGQRQPTSFWEDEDRAFNERSAPIMGAVAEIKADTVKAQVKAKFNTEHGNLWTAFETEIEEVLSKQPLAFRINPQSVEYAADVVIGRAARQHGFRVDSDGKGKRIFLEPASGSADPSKVEEPTAGLTARQLKAAKSFGMPLEDYKKSLAKLEIIQ